MYKKDFKKVTFMYIHVYKSVQYDLFILVIVYKSMQCLKAIILFVYNQNYNNCFVIFILLLNEFEYNLSMKLIDCFAKFIICFKKNQQ